MRDEVRGKVISGVPYKIVDEITVYMVCVYVYV